MSQQQNNYFDPAHASQTLARSLRKVDVFADTMFAQLDAMIESAGQGQWDKVARAGEMLALTSRAAGFRGVSALASVVHEEARKPYNEVETKRSLIRLIGMCGRAGTVESAREAVRQNAAALG